MEENREMERVREVVMDRKTTLPVLKEEHLGALMHDYEKKACDIGYALNQAMTEIKECNSLFHNLINNLADLVSEKTAGDVEKNFKDVSPEAMELIGIAAAIRLRCFGAMLYKILDSQGEVNELEKEIR